jgi:hypothetical protein
MTLNEVDEADKMGKKQTKMKQTNSREKKDYAVKRAENIARNKILFTELAMGLKNLDESSLSKAQQNSGSSTPAKEHHVSGDGNSVYVSIIVLIVSSLHSFLFTIVSLPITFQKIIFPHPWLNLLPKVMLLHPWLNSFLRAYQSKLPISVPQMQVSRPPRVLSLTWSQLLAYSTTFFHHLSRAFYQPKL